MVQENSSTLSQYLINLVKMCVKLYLFFIHLQAAIQYLVFTVMASADFLMFGWCKKRLMGNWQTLCEMPSEVTDTHIKKLGSFLMNVYDLKVKCDVTIDIFRMNQFCKSTTFNPRNLIISKKGLLQHTKWACLQAGWIWKKCEANVQASCPTN